VQQPADKKPSTCYHGYTSDPCSPRPRKKPTLPTLKRKVLAYIAHNGHLLVFRHRDFPEAGLQVPGGTLEAGERPEEAVLREATEETGLGGLLIQRRLGEQVRHMSDCGLDEIHHRFYYQLLCTAPPPETWTHAEEHPSDGDPAPIVFNLFWARLPNIPTLAGGQDYMLYRLIDFMIAEGTFYRIHP
jgi:8-oxo-dGTP diphosphatase